MSKILDTSENDRRIKLDMSPAAEKICVALDDLLTLRDTVRDTADISRKLAAFYLDAEKVTKASFILFICFKSRVFCCMYNNFLKPKKVD